jgi:hypothetical protein
VTSRKKRRNCKVLRTVAGLRQVGFHTTCSDKDKARVAQKRRDDPPKRNIQEMQSLCTGRCPGVVVCVAVCRPAAKGLGLCSSVGVERTGFEAPVTGGTNRGCVSS